MKAVIQRVRHASVTIEGRKAAAIEAGFLILLGIAAEDEREQAEHLAEKIAMLRICEDENGKMNKSLLDTDGQALVVSNFTVCADCSHGRRPSFVRAARPDKGKALYEYFCDCLRAKNVTQVKTGEFGADMQVALCNDGPVTIVLDTELDARH